MQTAAKTIDFEFTTKVDNVSPTYFAARSASLWTTKTMDEIFLTLSTTIRLTFLGYSQDDITSASLESQRIRQERHETLAKQKWDKKFRFRFGKYLGFRSCTADMIPFLLTTQGLNILAGDY